MVALWNRDKAFTTYEVECTFEPLDYVLPAYVLTYKAYQALGS